MPSMPGFPTISAPGVAGIPMNRAGFRPELFVPGLLEVFGLGVESIESRIPQLFHVMNSTRAYEEMLSMAGIGYFEQLLEGQPVTYQTISSRYKSLFYHLDYATGIRYTKKVKRDMMYFQLREAANLFGQSATATREELAAAFFNLGVIRNVHRQRQGLSSQSLYICGGFLGCFQVDISYYDVCPLPGKGHGNSLAYAPGSTCDQCHFIFKLHLTSLTARLQAALYPVFSLY